MRSRRLPMRTRDQTKAFPVPRPVALFDHGEVMSVGLFCSPFPPSPPLSLGFLPSFGSLLGAKIEDHEFVASFGSITGASVKADQQLQLQGPHVRRSQVSWSQQRSWQQRSLGQAKLHDLGDWSLYTASRIRAGNRHPNSTGPHRHVLLEWLHRFLECSGKI